MTSKKRDNMYLKLVELQAALAEEVDQQYIEKILQNGLDVNYKAPPYLTGQFKVGGMTALHLAKQRIDISKLLLRYGVDFKLKSSLGSSALHAAMERAYEHETYTAFPLMKSTCDFANLILSAHIQSKDFNNPCNSNGISHFHAACTVNNVEAVRFFLDNGVSVNQAIDVNYSLLPGYTALHIAVKYYNLEVVSLLLQYNADLYVKNSEGLNPVQMCVKQKMVVCKYKLQYSGSVDELLKKRLQSSDQILHLMFQKYSPIDDIGLSHLHIACVMANSSLAKHLLEQSIDIDHTLNHDSPIYAGYTALLLAAQCNIDTVKLLVAKGADMHLKDSKGWSQLDLFLQRYNVEEMHSILAYHPLWKDILLVDNKTKLLDVIDALRSSAVFHLIERNFGTNINLPLIPSNSPLWPGYTLLHLIVALTDDKYVMLDVCSEKGVDATTQDSFGSTPLHIAAENRAQNSWKIFMQLWKSYPKIANPVNENNLSHLHILSTDTFRCGPLKYLSETEDSNLMKELLLKDKEMEIQSHIPYRGRTIPDVVSGSTPLHLAVPDVEKTKLLMEYGADIYAVDAQGFTPFHRLIGKRVDEEFSEILMMTSDLKNCIVRNIGLSHLHVASHLDNVECLKKLLDRGADIDARISPELPVEFLFMEEYAGFTALQIAVNRRCNETVDFLVKHGADVFAKNAKNISLIYEILGFIKHNNLKVFVDSLKDNYALQRRFNEETGLTVFHVACHIFDVNLMKNYLQNAGANVNARARADSPIWPGLTALHILRDGMRLLGWDDESRNNKMSYEDDEIDELKKYDIVDDVLTFLLNNGADVTIADTNGDTPIHLFVQTMESSCAHYFSISSKIRDSFSPKIESICKKNYVRVSRLLKVHKDYSINPADSEDTSHFHVACRMNDFAVVQKFCKQGNIDINKPNHHGDTPLHLSVESSVVKFSGLAAQLKTIDCLLKNGAEVDIKNNIGNTPLHEAVRRSTADVKVFEKLFKAGADPNTENVFRSTPFELLCASDDSSVKHFKLFIKRGCQFNAYNPMSNEGFVRLLLNNQNPKWESILKLVLSLPEAKGTDSMGRTFVHNVVSSSWVNVDKCQKILQKLSNLGCDIDSQDKAGETALHKAVKCRSGTAVYALIESGADVNVADKNGKTALPFTFDISSQCWTSTLDNDDSKKYGIKTILLRHLAILDYCELPISHMNKDIIKDQRDEYSERFLQEISAANDVKIGDSLTLRRFLSGEMICDYPYTSLSNRNAIRAFVESIDNSEYQELKPFVILVFRQAEKRVGLISDAISSLRMLSGLPVPDVCSRIIFGCLINTDLQNLIAAAFEDV